MNNEEFEAVSVFAGKVFYVRHQQRDTLKSEMVKEISNHLQIKNTSYEVVQHGVVNFPDMARLMDQKRKEYLDQKYGKENFLKDQKSVQKIVLLCYFFKTGTMYHAYTEHDKHIYYATGQDYAALNGNMRKHFNDTEEVRFSLEFYGADPEQAVYLDHIQRTMDIPHIIIENKGVKILTVRYVRDHGHTLKGYFTHDETAYFVQGRNETDLLIGAQDKIFKIKRNHPYYRIDLKYIDLARDRELAAHLKAAELPFHDFEKKIVAKKVNYHLFPKPIFDFKDPWSGSPWPADPRAPGLFDPLLLAGLN